MAANDRRKGGRIGPFKEPETPVDAAQRIYGTVRRIGLPEITVDAEIQVRARGLDEARVEQYVEFLLNGGTFKDPIVLYQAGEPLLLSAGFHRVEAYRRAIERFQPTDDVHELAPLMAEIRTGGREAAIEWAEEDNLAHGKELSEEDKFNLLERRYKRGHRWVGYSDRAIAATLGVAHTTVGRWRKKIEKTTGAHAPVKGEKRIGADGRTYNTGNIQASNQRRAEARETAGAEYSAPDPPADRKREVATAIQHVMADQPAMTYREIEFAVNGKLGRIVNPGILSGIISEMSRDGRIRNVGGGRYALPDAPAPTPPARIDPPKPVSDDHDEPLDAAYRMFAEFGQALQHADESIRKLFEVRGIRTLYALPQDRMKQVYGDVTALRYLAEELSTYCDEQLKKLRLMSRTGQPYDEDGEA
ncbi:MAG: hypothetical protein WCZ87_00250 [Thiohalobacteraceae bacterium]